MSELDCGEAPSWTIASDHLQPAPLPSRYPAVAARLLQSPRAGLSHPTGGEGAPLQLCIGTELGERRQGTAGSAGVSELLQALPCNDRHAVHRSRKRHHPRETVLTDRLTPRAGLRGYTGKEICKDLTVRVLVYFLSPPLAERLKPTAGSDSVCSDLKGCQISFPRSGLPSRPIVLAQHAKNNELKLLNYFTVKFTVCSSPPLPISAGSFSHPTRKKKTLYIAPFLVVLQLTLTSVRPLIFKYPQR